jgi:hypothetical protein
MIVKMLLRNPPSPIPWEAKGKWRAIDEEYYLINVKHLN